MFSRRKSILAAIASVALGAVVALYLTGSLDPMLYKIGLNYLPCSTEHGSMWGPSGKAGVYCGDALAAYDHHAERLIARKAEEQRVAEQKAAKEAEQKAAEERILQASALRAEHLCTLLREYLHATPGEQSRILELMAQIAPSIANYGPFGRPTGFNIPSLKTQLAGDSCAGAE